MLCGYRTHSGHHKRTTSYNEGRLNPCTQYFHTMRAMCRGWSLPRLFLSQLRSCVPFLLAAIDAAASHRPRQGPSVMIVHSLSQSLVKSLCILLNHAYSNHSLFIFLFLAELELSIPCTGRSKCRAHKLLLPIPTCLSVRCAASSFMTLGQTHWDSTSVPMVRRRRESRVAL